MDWKWMVRATLLALAAALLPSAGCEGGDVGQGDELAQVTVRASFTLDGAEPRDASSHPSLSGDGRFVAFASAANNLTPNDSNSFQDIFLKDRLTGQIQNLTIYVVPASFAQYNPHDCYDPVITPDGRYVAFRTRGNYDPPFSIGGIPPLNSNTVLYRYDRILKAFDAAFPSAIDPNANLLEPTISSDGRYVVFLSSATNLPPAVSGGLVQVWVYDIVTDTTRLVSHSTVGATNPCNDNCERARISGNGQYVVFESMATNLTGQPTNSQNQIYRARLDVAPITIEAVAFNSLGVFTNLDSTCPAISEDGRYVAFYTSSTNLVTGVSLPYIVRRDMNPGGLTELVTDKPGIQDMPAAIFPPPCLPTQLSGDGRYVGFLSREGSLYPAMPLLFNQVFVRDMQGGIQMASRHLDGTPSNLECSDMALSLDAGWVAWETLGSTLVDGDTNGVPDIYLRGPLR